MSKLHKEYALNANQNHILKILYKFRFTTSTLLASFNGIHRVNSHKSLEASKRHKYIDSHYNKSYKLLGKGARYYLAPKGLKILKERFQLDEQVLHAMYKNKSVTEGFIDHNIDTVTIYLNIADVYPDIFDIYTKTELSSFDIFPDPRPDLFLNRLKESQTRTNQYFIELHHDKPPINARRRLSDLLEHYDEGEWDKDVYPTLCFVLKDHRAQQSFINYATRVLDSTGMDDEITILTTHIKEFGSQENTIWANTVNDKNLLAL